MARTQRNCSTKLSHKIRDVLIWACRFIRLKLYVHKIILLSLYYTRKTLQSITPVKRYSLSFTTVLMRFLLFQTRTNDSLCTDDCLRASDKLHKLRFFDLHFVIFTVLKEYLSAYWNEFLESEYDLKCTVKKRT